MLASTLLFALRLAKRAMASASSSPPGQRICRSSSTSLTLYSVLSQCAVSLKVCPMAKGWGGKSICVLARSGRLPRLRRCSRAWKQISRSSTPSPRGSILLATATAPRSALLQENICAVAQADARGEASPAPEMTRTGSCSLSDHGCGARRLKPDQERQLLTCSLRTWPSRLQAYGSADAAQPPCWRAGVVIFDESAEPEADSPVTTWQRAH